MSESQTSLGLENGCKKKFKLNSNRNETITMNISLGNIPEVLISSVSVRVSSTHVWRMR